MLDFEMKDLRCITTPGGFEISYSYNHIAGYMTATLMIQGIPNVLTFGTCGTVAEGRKNLSELTKQDAITHFQEIMSWEANKYISVADINSF